MKVLMVPVADRPECAAALTTAFKVARQLNANIRAFHIRPHRYSQVVLPPEGGFVISSDAFKAQEKSHERQAEAASGAAKGLVKRLAEHHDFKMVSRIKGKTLESIQWSEQVGDVASLLPLYGPFADLIVLSRPKNSKSRLAHAFLKTGLLQTPSPVLIVPHSGAQKIGKKIVIAWDRSHEAARAVHASMPLLQSADHVSIIASGEGKINGPKPQLLRDYLGAWGVASSITTARGVAGSDPVATITKHMLRERANLLVMGCYSRSRIRERVFGGVSVHMLYKARFPVFTLHS